MVNRYVGRPVRKQSGPGPRRKFKFEFQTNSTCSSLIQFKTDLPEVKKIFGIKYGWKSLELRNNFPYWNISRFGSEFE
jgi:hypothetical protein